MVYFSHKIRSLEVGGSWDGSAKQHCQGQSPVQFLWPFLVVSRWLQLQTLHPTFKGWEMAWTPSAHWNKKSKSLSSHWQELGHMTTPNAKEAENLRGGDGEGGGREEGEEGRVRVGCGEGSYRVSQPMVPTTKGIYVLCFCFSLAFNFFHYWQILNYNRCYISLNTNKQCLLINYTASSDTPNALCQITLTLF